MKYTKKTTLILVLIAVLLSLLLHILITVEGTWYLLLHPFRALSELIELMQKDSPKKDLPTAALPPELKPDINKKTQQKPKMQATAVTTIPFEELPKREQQHIIRHTRNSQAQASKDDIEIVGSQSEVTTTSYMPVEQPKGPEVSKEPIRQEQPNTSKQPLYSSDIAPVAPEEPENIEVTPIEPTDNEISEHAEPDNTEHAATGLKKQKKKKKRKKVKKGGPYGQTNDGVITGDREPIFNMFNQDRFYNTVAQIKGGGELDLNHLDAGDTRFTTYTNRIGRAIRTAIDALLIRNTYYRVHTQRFEREHRKAFVEFVIGSDGKVKHVTILKSCGIPEMDQFLYEAFMDIGSSLPPFPKWIKYQHMKLALWVTADPEDHASSVPSFGMVTTY